jgi:hypothetical protein
VSAVNDLDQVVQPIVDAGQRFAGHPALEQILKWEHTRN